MADTLWPPHVLDLVPNAVHTHHRSRFPMQDCNGEQSRDEVARFAADRGLRSVILTPHATNPGVGKPAPVSENEEQGQALRDYADGGSVDLGGIPLYLGIEDNILEGGRVCSPDQVQKNLDFVIASIHGLVPKDAAAVKERFALVSRQPYVDLIGHPGRYLDDVVGIDWLGIFSGLAEAGKMVEANFNAWFTYGPVKLRRQDMHTDADRVEQAQRAFYRAMGASGVEVVVSLDIHNAGMWPDVEPAHDWSPSVQQLEDYLRMLASEGIANKQIVNSSLEDYIASRWIPVDA